jgi:NitT/TauT family transport system substrate-binding protein
MMHNLRSRLAGAVLCLSAGLTLAPAVHAQALDAVNFTLPWLPVGDYAFYSAGVHQGFYRAEGIDLKINRGFGSIDAVTKIAAGTFTAGEVEMAAVVLGRVKQNSDVRCIGVAQTVAPIALLVGENSGIDTLKDLEGKLVATQPGNTTLLYMPLLARTQGFDAAKVRTTNVEAATMASLLLQGRVDAAPFYATNAEFINRTGEALGKRVKALRFADNGLSIYGQCLAATGETMRSKPELMQRFLSATFKAREWVRSNPDEAARMHSQMFPEVKREDAALSLKAVLPYVFNDVTTADGIGRFNDARLRQTFQAVAEAQGLDMNFDYRTVIDTSALPK